MPAPESSDLSMARADGVLIRAAIVVIVGMIVVVPLLG